MDKSSRSDRPFHVAFVLLDGFALMSYSSAQEPLRAANMLNPGAYRLTHLSVAGGLVMSSSGAMLPTAAIDVPDARFDLILIIAGGDPMRFQSAVLFSWLRGQSRQGVMMGGVSGGPVILANAGLMHGRRMTLHWEHAKALAESEPALMIERNLYVFDRDRVTCAGGTAPLDMMHTLITQHHGAPFARQVSDWFMHTAVRLSSAPQRAGLAERYNTNNQTVLAVLDIMESHVADPLNLAELSRRMDVGVRQLNRLFKDKLGKSTMGFYRDMRLSVAENLLAQSHLSVTEIALACGFASAAHFSNRFKTRYGTAPSVIRSRTSA